ncbi:hypothetical protein LJC60_09515 [Ruminococcaceae bacterium OttesenSCG-928-D13]|nr:hypothetical protein [Ruminococcaceae bacterium OttesenSCG-928-D13]
MDYTFRLAAPKDKPAIIAFMRKHWDSRHPLIELPDFFSYYYEAFPGRLSFALCEQGDAIAALAGLVAASAAPSPDLWVSLWVADKAAKGSGLELMEQIPALTGCHTLACNNIRPETLPFYRFLGFEAGRVGHFYRLADRPPDGYRLARIAEKDIPPATGDAALALLPDAAALAASGFVPPAGISPRKDLWYLARRYFNYPRQRYALYAATAPGAATPTALLALRVIPAAGTHVLRIADYIGPVDFLPRCGAAIARLMAEFGAEYADCYCAGIPAETMRAAGFAERVENSPNIIPNYLDPPLYENTDYYYFTSRPKGFTLFKADGDQDRPNTPV